MTEFYDYLMRECHYVTESAEARERAITRLVEFGYTEDQLKNGNITAMVEAYFKSKGTKISRPMMAIYRNALRVYRNFREASSW